MKTDLLKNSEIFVFLALVFSIFTASLLSNEVALNENGIQLGKDRDNMTDKYEKCKDSLDGYKISYENLEEKYKKCKDSLNGYKISYENLEEKYKKCKDSLDIIKSKYKTPHIEIKGTEKFFFKTGSSKINDDFENYLIDSIIPKLNTLLQKCTSCNAIYIVGHTDGENGTKYKNNRFDEDIVQVINYGDFKYNYNSNTDLGIQRAMSIYSLLEKRSELKERIKYWFPYSAGPFINPKSGELIKNLLVEDDNKKRRIEIWVHAYNH